MMAQPVVKTNETKDTNKYLRGVKSEFKKVVWPTKEQVIKYSTVVIVVSILSALVLSAYDEIVYFIIKLIVGR
ncbi:MULTISPECIES: preprotein translocase subunit SecE [Peptoniphilus]|nr:MULTISPECIES: preprotein translocase subunit SecE [Peptoniphilus]MDK8276150.1 preprotein translocase subunit SecE [Peptoniphilus duerdenii]